MKTCHSFGLTVRTALSLVALLLIAPIGSAKPAYKKELVNHLGPFLSVKLHDCRVCHLPEAEGERPHNAFGERLKEVGRELRKAGQESDIPARLNAVANEDSDGDGVANLLELIAGHFPGEKSDAPSADEIKTATQRLVEFRKIEPTYRWKPFAAVKPPTVPKITGDWGQNPVDAFLAEDHQKRGLTHRPEADRATLLRRVFLDLIGLPPTPDELHAFLNDASPTAYEKVVDRLLASPRYGERWARHWMDVWRYSDWAGWTDGNQIRDSHPHIWRWRDWIVESLNADKGYDRMIQEMLAGDELAPNDPDTLRATGFLVRNYKMLSREKWLQDTVDHTFQAFQATTIGCAKCHDHFYDPLKQQEYYQLRAIFEPHRVRIDRIPGVVDPKKDGLSRVYDADLTPKTQLLIRGDERTPDDKPLSPGIPAALGGKLNINLVPLPASAVRPDQRAFVRSDLLKAADAEVTRTEIAKTKAPADKADVAKLEHSIAVAKRDALKAVLAVEEIEEAGYKQPDAAKAATAAQRTEALILAKQSLAVAKAALAKADAKATDAAKKKVADAEKLLADAEANAKQPVTTEFKRRDMPTYPEASTGRRLAFAQWLTAKENPLTARVAVNHIWLRHFGQAIVPSVFDFGKNGRAPTHPALLDWLASEFMRQGWKMKPLHRMLVTSQAYRQASTPDAENLARDRDNVYYWRMAPRRLDAESVRDQLLSVAGKLDLMMGGPEVDHNTGMTVNRRSVYFRSAAERQMEFLKIFDCASVTECYERKESISPQQALALQNNPLAVTLSRHLARDLSAKENDAKAFVNAAFERILCRRPTEAEAAECAKFLGDVAWSNTSVLEFNTQVPSSHADVRKRESLILVLFNHHEFVTIR